MKIEIALTSLAVFMWCCSGENDNSAAQVRWKKPGLHGKIVNEIQLSGSNQ